MLYIQALDRDQEPSVYIKKIVLLWQRDHGVFEVKRNAQGDCLTHTLHSQYICAVFSIYIKKHTLQGLCEQKSSTETHSGGQGRGF